MMKKWPRFNMISVYYYCSYILTVEVNVVGCVFMKFKEDNDIWIILLSN